MRLTLVTETYLPQVNGVSRTLSKLVEEMTRAGVQVQVVHPDYHEKELPPNHVTIRSITLPWYKDVCLPMPPFGKVNRAIDAFRPDIVHIATEATLGLSSLLHCRRKGYPVVTSFHTNWTHYSGHYGVGWLRGIIMAYIRWFHFRAIETYVPSQTTINELKERGFRNLVLWPRGVDGRLFRPDRPGREAVRAALGFTPEHVVIGHVSRIAPEKNVDYLAQALSIVAESRPNARFLFVGDGPSRGELEAKMGPHAKFAGYRSGEDLADHYAAADLFAFASLTETFGNVVLEAMATGLPVVAVRAGGVGDIVHQDVTGALINPSDPPSLFADRLIQLIDNPTLRQTFSQQARTHAESQTWEAIMSSLRRRYEAVVARTGQR